MKSEINQNNDTNNENNNDGRRRRRRSRRERAMTMTMKNALILFNINSNQMSSISKTGRKLHKIKTKMMDKTKCYLSVWLAGWLADCLPACLMCRSMCARCARRVLCAMLCGVGIFNEFHRHSRFLFISIRYSSHRVMMHSIVLLLCFISFSFSIFCSPFQCFSHSALILAR